LKQLEKTETTSRVLYPQHYKTRKIKTCLAYPFVQKGDIYRTDFLQKSWLEWR